MNEQEKKAILTIALLAAQADGGQDDRERAQVRQVIDSLGASLNVPALYQDVLLGRASLQTAAAALGTAPLRTLALEIAIGVCDADGLRNDAETRFIATLGHALGASQPEIASVAADADALAVLPLPLPAPAGAAGAAGAAATGPGAAAPRAASADVDAMITRAAITNGALELLPQNLASMAIIPLQMRLVYRVGEAHGYTLDRDHIRDLLATLGVGLAGQYLEQMGRKLVGGLLGKVGGGLLGGLGGVATGAAFSFATTWAIGQVARRYYAGGRTMSTDLLRSTYQDLLGEGRRLQTQYLPQMQQEARTIDPARIMQMVRGG